MSKTENDPRSVAAGLLDDQRMIAACTAHDIQSVLRLLRDHGASMSALASVIGVSLSRLHEYWTGAHQPSSFEFFEHVSDGLRIPGRYLRLADRPWERSSTNA